MNVQYDQLTQSSDATIEVYDWSDTECLKEIMDQWSEKSTEPFYGHNQIGEFLSITVCTDVIILGTFQNNGWYRKNYYYRDGTCEELFEGKWDR